MMMITKWHSGGRLTGFMALTAVSQQKLRCPCSSLSLSVVDLKISSVVDLKINSVVDLKINKRLGINELPHLNRINAVQKGSRLLASRSNLGISLLS
ncbi:MULTISPECIES: hypothetical protein [Yersinia pseudotuberculosis complex]|uniref:Uncharacterized protein n=2 Tax=Yersinia pseudotuberculosis TaxID=633 RepID=Q66FE9_YERPS|nr:MULTISPECIES: hypothetical protein [Yersinia pseudotuberculosis complex]CQD58285.1 Uncharacterised protein [Yersinia intermedia]GAE13041.1 hypothetical protein YP1_082_00310 [Yersinia pseudotuberculosis NBRC 105692]AJJ68161.1 hypothetical protein BZ16_3873 [Yersinia pseudotuberculosis PB1/+]AXY34776.1 hypothetical protein CEQ20_16235 [Yersinia pseudotuberculosis]AYW90879.1 hypothetical protein EGX47_05750 [Yersinia pseudotuberculosis]